MVMIHHYRTSGAEALQSRGDRGLARCHGGVACGGVECGVFVDPFNVTSNAELYDDTLDGTHFGWRTNALKVNERRRDLRARRYGPPPGQPTPNS